MAIFHLTAKIISRGKGQSAIAAAAYRSGERLRDEQAGEQKFYQTRAERIQFTDIMAPSGAPEWAHDRNQLWNEAERAEKRKDAQLAREIEISLPHELTPEQRVWLVKDFAREAFVRRGYAVDLAIHAPDKEGDERNHHAHLMVTMRTLGPDGFALKKDPSMNKREQLTEWRGQWAHLANRHLERHGFASRIDHRSLEAQGIEREAGVHVGYAANEMTQRGAQSDRMDALKQVMARNDIRVEIKAIDGEVRELERLAAKAEELARELDERRRTEEQARADKGLDWTDRGGMVAQQQAALRSLRRAAAEKARVIPGESKTPKQQPEPMRFSFTPMTGTATPANFAESFSPPASKQPEPDKSPPCGAVPAEKQAEHKAAQEKTTKERVFTRDIGDGDRARDRDHDQEGGRGGRGRTR
ncbi:MobQ family relaxase [Methylocapsa aurea]|uniref:MobQ family relaxase n=1 Tax=Methylocapsa aurea TaxID=663610 RepID=UPI000A90D8BD|nr:MobQ family relaxase [Methylocapsa aurea]